MRQAPRKRSGLAAHFIGGTIAHSFVFCNGVWGIPWADGVVAACALLQRGIGLACALHQRKVWLSVRRCPTGPPSNVFWYRGTPPVPPAGAAPPAPLLGEMRKAPSFHLAHRPTLLGTGGLTILPRKQRPLRPAWGRRGTGTLPSLPPNTRAGTEAPPGGLGEGDGTVAKRDLARSQRGHSPVNRGHSPNSR